jgi:hypothetical protein
LPSANFRAKAAIAAKDHVQIHRRDHRFQVRVFIFRDL